ncbi:SCL-interrupting locus protein homolog [Megalops cyprinoides]|uniref:SCL-interrupting locus protein homolog n=1 Tax=Megalops cyprinoides TaxID=118141 RepID=UPI0018653682|nr:SCL-interrupting locus protein homolog [Megalops cyprinoides]
MSVQVNFRGLPPHVLEGVYTKPEQRPRSSEKVLTPLTFPKSKVALWDPSPNGDVVSLHVSYYRNPRLLVVEKAIRLAHRHARQSNKEVFSCFLLGALAVDDDEEGVTLTLDRFDPGREQPGSSGKCPTALLPGDFLVPCTISTQGVVSTDTMVHSSEDFDITFKMLQHSCCSRGAMELSKLLTLRAHLGCSEHLDSLNFSLNWVAVTIANTLDAVPVRPVPIIPTALARNLSSPGSVAQPLHGACRKQGFLTMDQTRKLLLILESDPKAYTLPLVGVWLSGITHIHNPQVWAWCLRYLYSSSLQDRVMSEGGAFLVVLYSLTHRDPEFYQCQLCSGQQEMGFQLLTGTESLALYKNVEVPDGRPLQFELSAESQNQETEFFKEVASRVSFTRTPGASGGASPQNKLSVSDHDSGVEDEDLSPRPSPNPHPLGQQTRRIHPSVPELSLVMDGSFLDGRKAAAHEPAVPQGRSAPASLQRRGSAPTPHTQSGCRPPGQVPHLSGPPPIRRPLTPVIPQAKVKGHISPGQQQQQLQSCTGRKSAPPTGRKSTGGSSTSSASSASSSSSSSTPNVGRSPNSSIHQHRQHPIAAAAPHRGLSPTTPCPPHSSTSLTPPSGYRSPRHSSGFPNQAPMHPHHLKNVHNASSPNSGGLPCSCCSHQHGHTPAYHSSPWPGVPSTPAPPHGAPSHPGGVCCPPSESTPHHDCCCSPSHQPLGCQASPHQSPVCVTGSPVHHLSPHGVCSPVKDAGTHTRVPMEKPVSTCQAQCCQGQSGCHFLPAGPTHTSAGGPMGILPADAYRILVDQDRQLKLLQAQIQKLLEAQGKAGSTSPSSATPPPVSTEQPAPQQERRSVSVAVCTGASLFWSPPADGSGHGSSLPEPQWQCEAGSACAASSHRDNSTDTPQFIHCTEEEPRRLSADTPSLLSGVGGQGCESSVGERASMCCPAQSPSRDSQQCQQATTVEDEFYHELLGQVSTRLQNCVSVDEGEDEQATWVTHPRDRQSISPPKSQPTGSSPTPPRPHSQKRNSSPKQPAQDQVLQATLRQLKQLGVTVELDSAPPGIRTTVESASTLACINPEAVVPRLALSESVGASIWGPGASTDLSLEANAIALKYLSDSHLSQFSKGGGPARALAAHNAVLSGKAVVEKSAVGLSILSPSNMSFATKKYMKKYGLMEGGESSEEEGDVLDEDGEKRDEQFKCSGNFAVAQAEKGERSLVLKNITNEPVHSIPLRTQNSPDTQSQLLRELRPKMQLLSRSTRKSPQKENNAPAAPGKQQPRLTETHGAPGTEESVGNFLDLSRLRQLPKLF